MVARRFRRRLRRWARHHPLAAAVAALVLAVAVVHVGHAAAGAAGTNSGPGGPAAGQVIAYARAQIGCPYVWGGTGPCQSGYDCSGLVMEAFRQAGITFSSSRPTADTEWQYGPQVASPAPGDLVFFAGSDGTDADPGHVGIVVNPARHLMIDAYGSGYPITLETYGLPTSRDGLADPVGFTAPGSGS